MEERPFSLQIISEIKQPKFLDNFSFNKTTEAM